MPITERQRELCELLGISEQLVEDVIEQTGFVCPMCEEGAGKCKCDIEEAVQGPVSNAEMNRKADIKAENVPSNPVAQNFDPQKKSLAQKEAEKNKKRQEKMQDEVQNDLRTKHNQKKDEVTFYPSTDKV